MARKKNKKGLPTSNWMDTYADCITLLMTFFVLLYSMSSVDAAKLQSLSEALTTMLTGQKADSMVQYDLYQGKVPLVGGEGQVDIKIENDGEEDKDGQMSEESTKDDVEEFVKKNELESIVSIISDERGIIIQLKDSILFETGQAELKESSKSVLNKINVLISTLPNNIIVEGHTDNVPINTYQFPSNWELSGARASRVVRFFTDEKGQPMKRFTAQGCGESKPVKDNSTPENRAENRRVNILIVANENGNKEG